ncbi:MAG: deoxyribonuclease IV [Candidatus Izemoplasmatales bacterium]|nr:deoxyribonuclease IV [Candidatus Izemoplasmatales bacterium]
MIIGCHVSFKGEDLFLGSVKEAISFGANAFMIYTGAPQNTFRKPIESLQIEAGSALMKAENLSKEYVVIHAPYIVNLANPIAKNREFAIAFLTEEVKRTTALGAPTIVLHPGSHLGQGVETGIQWISDGINAIIDNTPDSHVVIALETMAGKGSEVGRTFEELRWIIDHVKVTERVGVCLDTCHIHDAGYDIINRQSEVLHELDQTIGFDRIRVLHLNDSKNPTAAHKDRHENFGFGALGFEPLMRIIHHPAFKSVPKILETPFVQGVKRPQASYPPYDHEIKMIKNNSFESRLIEMILDHYEGDLK